MTFFILIEQHKTCLRDWITKSHTQLLEHLLNQIKSSKHKFALLYWQGRNKEHRLPTHKSPATWLVKSSSNYLVFILWRTKPGKSRSLCKKIEIQRECPEKKNSPIYKPFFFSFWFLKLDLMPQTWDRSIRKWRLAGLWTL